jgi:ferredoxin
MGHLVGKDAYRQLGKKIDNLTVRAPWNDKLFAILKELYSEDEANLVIQMPYAMASFSRLARATQIEEPKLRKLLAGLCKKGLVIDICVGGKYRYMPSPMVIGIFEFTMMRRGEEVKAQEWAKLFDAYMHGEEGFLSANFSKGEKISIMRALPHEGSVKPEEHVEVLDYEKATAIIEQTDRFSIGLCSCRHEKHHLGDRTCKVPLEKCSSYGMAADFLIRNDLAREVSKTEMLENLAESKEMCLVLAADNVRQRVGFTCHCCGCCCNMLQGITRSGLPHTLVTSSFIAKSDRETCLGCKVCARRCPIDAIEMVPAEEPKFKKFGRPVVDESACLGCGVCTLRCKSGAMKLTKRRERVLHPETTFERTILQCLERGTLQNQLFADPASKTHQFMRGLVGGFLRIPPVKQVLMTDTLRSSFLAAMTSGAKRQRKAWTTEM